MQYFDTGQRNPADALGSWLLSVLDATVMTFRCQTGFFSGEPLGLLQPTFSRLATISGVVRILVGSNDGGTMRADLEELLAAVGGPRASLELGVVAFEDGFFHPKTIHLSRNDGSAVAYVGSANLTGAGAASGHVEAGLVVDTRTGDSPAVLNEIAARVDWWFASRPPGLTVVRASADLDPLVAAGAIGRPRPPPLPRAPPASATPSTTPVNAPRLSRLIKLPPRVQVAVAPVQAAPAVAFALVPSVPRVGYPNYLLFAPAASVPTSGVGALTGATLPGGAAGLIIRLNNDSARHFAGRDGTANISIPVATLATIRFGILPARKPNRAGRPRAEFELRVRYIGSNGQQLLMDVETNVMGYGFDDDESGHGDVRFLVPASVRDLVTGSYAKPASGDAAVLEWPTASEPAFRLTFIEKTTPLHATLSGAITNAEAIGQNVGGGACWLPPGLVPVWPP